MSFLWGEEEAVTPSKATPPLVETAPPKPTPPPTLLLLGCSRDTRFVILIDESAFFTRGFRPEPTFRFFTGGGEGDFKQSQGVEVGPPMVTVRCPISLSGGWLGLVGGVMGGAMSQSSSSGAAMVSV